MSSVVGTINAAYGFKTLPSARSINYDCELGLYFTFVAHFKVKLKCQMTIVNLET